MPTHLNAKEVAELTGVSVSSVRRDIKRGVLPGFKLDGDKAWHIDRAVVEQYRLHWKEWRKRPRNFARDSMFAKATGAEAVQQAAIRERIEGMGAFAFVDFKPGLCACGQPARIVFEKEEGKEEVAALCGRCWLVSEDYRR